MSPKPLVIAGVALLSVTLAAQSPNRAVNAPKARATASTATLNGFSTERLARIEQFLQRYVDDGIIAGAVALVLRDGKPVYERAVGWSDKEAQRPMRADTIFRIASQTKAITSAATLLLVEEGRIGLGDQVSKYIPAFGKTSVATATINRTEIVPARRAITVRDLLTHTAGISYSAQNVLAPLYEAQGLGPAAGFGWYTADKDELICDTMERLASLPFVAQPGEAWIYGYSTDVLGCVVEQASGTPLDEFVRTRITGPLGMKDTQFFLSASDRTRLAAVYTTDENGRGARRAPDGPKGQGDYVDGPRRSFSGGAGLLSTARDYARFLEMIRNGGVLDGIRILAPRTVKLMTTNQVGNLHSENGLGFGLGFETSDRFGASSMDEKGAFGWGGAYGSVYRVDPESRIVMLMMLQHFGPAAGEVRQRFPAVVYQALVEP